MSGRDEQPLPKELPRCGCGKHKVWLVKRRRELFANDGILLMCVNQAGQIREEFGKWNLLEYSNRVFYIYKNAKAMYCESCKVFADDKTFDILMKQFVIEVLNR